VLGHCASVTDDAAIASAVADAVEAWGGLDILVNNAGIAQRPAPAMSAEPDEIDHIFAVNLRGIFHVTRHALAALREAEGSIINLASNAALRPRPGMAWYNASKAAVMNLTQTLAAEYAPYVRVNAIAPSLAETPMKDFIMGERAAEGVPAVLSSIPMGRLCTGADVAAAATYLASEDAAFVTGVILPVDGGRMVG
jgi:3-oxoacyl-[acyl-carrier protein] reductase